MTGELRQVITRREYADVAGFCKSATPAKIRVLVKRILRKHGYPPDKQEKATQKLLEQAAVLSAEWAPA